MSASRRSVVPSRKRSKTRIEVAVELPIALGESRGDAVESLRPGHSLQGKET